MSETGGRGGWHPDPTGRFEFRWFNGERWTADVSVHGRRFVDPGGPPTYQPGWGPVAPAHEARPTKAMAVASFVIGLVALLIAWAPFVFVLAAIGAVLAFVFGLLALGKVRRGEGTGKGFAVSGLVLSVAAAGLCVVGFVLTGLVLDEVNDYLQPGPTSTTVRCIAARPATAAGTITNLDDETHDYRVEVGFYRDGELQALATVDVDRVGPGDDAEFIATGTYMFAAPLASLTCTVRNVYGPEPFAP